MIHYKVEVTKFMSCAMNEPRRISLLKLFPRFPPWQMRSMGMTEHELIPYEWWRLRRYFDLLSHSILVDPAEKFCDPRVDTRQALFGALYAPRHNSY